MATNKDSVLTLLVLLPIVFSGRELPDEWQADIDAHADDIAAIIDYIQDEGKVSYNQAYDRLAYLTDIYGSRISGSVGLEKAIDFLYDEMKQEFGDDNVWTENVTVPHWERNDEWASVVVPITGRVHRMDIMAAGTSVGTGAQDITGHIVIVHDIFELDGCASDLHQDKIVVYNQDWPDNGYDGVFMYRSEGGYRAEQCGAKAALIRSLTPFSVYSPHTGTQSQTLESTIPAACITVEDAELLERLTEYTSDEVEVTIHMEAQNYERAQSRNLIAQIPGREKTDEYVIFGGHIDSWDVGTGAMDDGGGVIVSWQVLSTVKQMIDDNILEQPRRTMMAILWTSEEIDSAGANDFFANYKEEKVSLIMESDAGTFKPTGLGFSGSGLSRAIMEEILMYLEPIDAHRVSDNMEGSVDITPWMNDNRTSAVLNNQNDHYWIFHHTHGDTMTVQDREQMDLCSILWTASAYVVADVEEMLPEEGEYPWVPDPTEPPVSSAAIPTFPLLLSLLLLV